MNETRLQWVIAGIGVFVALAYFVWLCTVYAKFMDTDRYVRAAVADYYARASAVPDLDLEVDCEDCPDVSDSDRGSDSNN